MGYKLLKLKECICVLESRIDMRLRYILCCVLLAGTVACDSEPSFHPNGKTILAGAVVCPDSLGARSEFHKSIQAAETLANMEQQIKQQYGDPSSYDQMTNAIHGLPLVNFLETHKPDFSPYGCSELESGIPIYIENEDATGIATITAKLPDDTLLHGITYASEVQSNASGK